MTKCTHSQMRIPTYPHHGQDTEHFHHPHKFPSAIWRQSLLPYKAPGSCQSTF